jgi:iron complex outermembrane receptor protein
LNVTLFNTDLKNFQDRSFNGTLFLVRNAGNVRSRGVDVDGQFRPLSMLNISYGVTYLDAVYTSDKNAPGLEGCLPIPGACPTVQDLSGRALNHAPRWNGDVTAELTSQPFLGGYTASLAATETFTSSMLTANTDNPQSRVPGHATTDLRLSFHSPDNRYELDLFGTNVFDKHYYVDTVAQPLGVIMGINNIHTGATVFRGFLGDPQRFGVRLSAKF